MIKKSNKCFSCELDHPKVEASGIWYCPNALCMGTGGAWFRAKLDSYRETENYTHTVDECEWLTKGKTYNKKNKITRQAFRRKKHENNVR